jgi:hypothetical protein
MTIRRIATTSALALGLMALLFTVACGSSSPSYSTAPTPTPTPTPGGGGGGGTAPTLTDVQTQIFNQYCTSCHTGNGRTPSGGMSLDATASYAALVNVGSSGKPGAIRVIPGDPDNSFLVQKLEGAAGIVGLRMPRTGPPYLTDAQVLLVRQWIAAGALNN